MNEDIKSYIESICKKICGFFTRKSCFSFLGNSIKDNDIPTQIIISSKLQNHCDSLNNMFWSVYYMLTEKFIRSVCDNKQECMDYVFRSLEGYLADYDEASESEVFVLIKDILQNSIDSFYEYELGYYDKVVLMDEIDRRLDGLEYKGSELKAIKTLLHKILDSYDSWGDSALIVVAIAKESLRGAKMDGDTRDEILIHLTRYQNTVMKFNTSSTITVQDFLYKFIDKKQEYILFASVLFILYKKVKFLSYMKKDLVLKRKYNYLEHKNPQKNKKNKKIEDDMEVNAKKICIYSENGYKEDIMNNSVIDEEFEKDSLEEINKIVEEFSLEDRVIFKLTYGQKLNGGEFVRVIEELGFKQRVEEFNSKLTTTEKLFMKFKYYNELSDEDIDKFILQNIDEVKKSIDKKVESFKLVYSKKSSEKDLVYLKLYSNEPLNSKELAMIVGEGKERRVEKIRDKIKRRLSKGGKDE